MANVRCPHPVSQFQSACADQEVGQRNTDSGRQALAVDPPRSKRDRNRDWLNRHTCDQLIEESLAPVPALGSIGTSDAVGEFEDLVADFEGEIVLFFDGTDAVGNPRSFVAILEPFVLCHRIVMKSSEYRTACSMPGSVRSCQTKSSVSWYATSTSPLIPLFKKET